jgi:hypothetical protein
VVAGGAWAKPAAPPARQTPDAGAPAAGTLTLAPNPQPALPTPPSPPTPPEGNFRSIGSDTGSQVAINEAAAKFMGNNE